MSFSENLVKSEIDRLRPLVSSPDWYKEYGRVQRILARGRVAVQTTMHGSIFEAKRNARNHEIEVFEQLLSEDAIRLGNPETDQLEDWDAERQPIDRIVIHHSNRSGGISLSKLNAMHFLDHYVPRYQKAIGETDPKEQLPLENGQMQPIYSGHFDENGTQIFYGYHWKIDQDGTKTRLLPDSAIGWHAGNWEVNTRSAGLVIDDDLREKPPTPEALDALATIIEAHYDFLDISPKTLLGHKAVSNIATDCPGDLFETHWKQNLLRRLG